ncbi:hypothetical protein A2U01_0073248, partial [Trifolium medium]|nr:hypothetical protein [Trifolium medium]
IAKILKKMKDGAPMPQEIVEIDEETESDEGIVVRVQTIADRVKMYKSQKVEIPRNTGTGKKELKKKRKASYWGKNIEKEAGDNFK